jgi:hypothetical protein
MALVIEEQNVKDASASDTGTATNRKVGRDWVLLVCIYMRDQDDIEDPSSVTYDGIELTQLSNPHAAGPALTDLGSWVYYLNMHGRRSIKKGDITVTFPGSKLIWWFEYIMISGGTPLDVFDGTTAQVSYEQNQLTPDSSSTSSASSPPYKADLDITTTRANTWVWFTGCSQYDVAAYTAGATQAFKWALSSSRGWGYYLQVTEPGLQTMTVEHLSQGYNGMTIFGIAEQARPSFNVMSDLVGGDATVAQRFWNRNAKNLMVLGDSFTLSTLHEHRMGAGIMTGWNHPAGWGGFHWPAFNGISNQFLVLETVTATVSGAEQTLQYMSNEANSPPNPGIGMMIFNDTYAPGANCGGIQEWHVNASYDNSGEANGVITDSQLLVDDYGGTRETVVSNWIKDQDIRAKPIYMYSSTGVGSSSSSGNPHDGMIADINVRTGSGDGSPITGSPFTLATDYEPSLGLEDAADGDSGFNLLNAEITIDTSSETNSHIQLADTANWDSATENLSYVHCGYKVYRADRTGITSLVWADNSWDTDDHAMDSDKTKDGGGKHSRDSEIRRWMEIMFDTSEPLYLFFWQYCDYADISVSNYMSHLEDIRIRYTEAWQAVGGTTVNFIWGGSWRAVGGVAVDGNTQTQTENEAMWRHAESAPGVFYINAYGLTGGIVWDNSDTGGDQSAWAESKGWNAIPHLNGTVDVSTKDLLDVPGTHANTTEAAFFFAYILAEVFEQYATGAAGMSKVRSSPYAPRIRP